jgi:hypothetical protein
MLSCLTTTAETCLSQLVTLLPLKTECNGQKNICLRTQGHINTEQAHPALTRLELDETVRPTCMQYSTAHLAPVGQPVTDVDNLMYPGILVMLSHHATLHDSQGRKRDSGFTALA